MVPKVLHMLRDPDKLHCVLKSIAIDVSLCGRTPVNVYSTISLKDNELISNGSVRVLSAAHARFHLAIGKSHRHTWTYYHDNYWQQ